MVRKAYKINNATIRIHDDYVTSQEETRYILEKAYKLALVELCSNTVEGMDINQNPLRSNRDES